MIPNPSLLKEDKDLKEYTLRIMQKGYGTGLKSVLDTEKEFNNPEYCPQVYCDIYQLCQRNDMKNCENYFKTLPLTTRTNLGLLRKMGNSAKKTIHNSSNLIKMSQEILE